MVRCSVDGPGWRRKPTGSRIRGATVPGDRLVPGEHWVDAFGGGEYLRCLKDTLPGDRQVVWEGRHGRGIVGVVDFGDYRRGVRRGVYERWVRYTSLSPVSSRERVLVDPVLGLRFGPAGAKGLQGNAIRLTPTEAYASEVLAGGLPEQRLPSDRPYGDEDVIDWTGAEGLPVEVIIETAAATSRRVWRKLRFSERPRTQVSVPGAARPDLLAPGVVGDAKRRVRRDDGPAQIKRYLDALSKQQPQHAPWRGVLIQHADDLDRAAVAELRASVPYQLSVFHVHKGMRWHVKRLHSQRRP